MQEYIDRNFIDILRTGPDINFKYLIVCLSDKNFKYDEFYKDLYMRIKLVKKYSLSKVSFSLAKFAYKV